MALKRAINLSGIIIPVPTPFRDDPQQSVDYEKLKENISKWEKLPFVGYCIGASYSERPYLSDEEKLQILKIVKSSIHPSKFVMAGTTRESTKHTLELSLAAIEAGADVILLMTPNYFRTLMTQDVIVEHFTTIADAISVPVVVYNNPYTTGIDIGLPTIEILSNHPNICGIKDTEVFKMSNIVEKTKNKGFSVLAAAAGYLLPSLLMGCSGGMVGSAAFLGAPICEMFALARAGEWTKASEIQKRLLAPDTAILRELGAPGLKAAMDVMGYSGGHCRRPLLPLDKHAETKIREILQQSGYLEE